MPNHKPIVIPQPQLKTLLICSVKGLGQLVEAKGIANAHAWEDRHDAEVRSLLSDFKGMEIDKTDGFFFLFSRPGDAVGFALNYMKHLKELTPEDVDISGHIGIHLGEVYLRENTEEDINRGAKPIEVEGLAKPMTARVMSATMKNQILMTHGAFDLARRASEDGVFGQMDMRWMAHGPYLFKGLEEPVDLYEVGEVGLAPLCAPESSTKVSRVHGDERIQGWRPAQGQEVPLRPNWYLEKKLGEGGFGEVWLASHKKTGDFRVFKFCFFSNRLKGLQREVTLFRMLKMGLGNRSDINRILDWNFEEAPYFIESEYTQGGSLLEWAETKGGLGQIDLRTKLKIVAQIAEALAAAHSMGILHKDIKPGNVLIKEIDGEIQAQLADFGIGMLTDKAHLEELKITVLGFSQTSTTDEYSFGGTQKYQAPEILEGKMPTHQSDIYALGVLFYELLVNSFDKALSPGWERSISNPTLREDLMRIVDGNPERRISDAKEISLLLRDFEKRDQERMREEEAQLEAKRIKRELEKARKKRNIMMVAGAALLIFGGAMAFQAHRISLEAARANREAETAKQITRFLTNVFKVADPASNRGSSITARELLDASAQSVKQELKEQPMVQARIQAAMGTAYLNLGLYDQAQSLLEGSYQVLKGHLSDTNSDTLSVADALAQLYIRKSQFEVAEKLLKTNLALKERTFGKSSPELIPTHEAMILLYTQMGQLAKALPHTRALELLEKDRVKTTPTSEPRSQHGHLGLQLVKELPLPPDTLRLLGEAPMPGYAMACGKSALFLVDTNGREATRSLDLKENEDVISKLPSGHIVIQTPTEILSRDYFSDQKLSDDILLKGLDPKSEVLLSPAGDSMVVILGTSFSSYQLKNGKFVKTHSWEAQMLPDQPKALTSNYFGWFDYSLEGKGLHVVSLKTGKEILTTKDWQGRPMSLGIDDYSKIVVVAGWFNEVYQYTLGTPNPKVYSFPFKKFGPILFLRDRQTFVIGGDDNLAVIDSCSEKSHVYQAAGSRDFPVEHGLMGIMVFESNKKKMLSFSYSSVPIQDEIRASTRELWTVAASSDGRKVYLGAADGGLHRYDRDTRELVSFPGHTLGVTGIEAMDDKIISASDDKTLVLWDDKTLTKISETKGHKYLINELFWEEKNQLLWSASSDRNLKSWRLPDFKEVDSVPIQANSISDLWIDSQRGLALLGIWGGDWLELKKQPEWKITRREVLGCEVVYKVVALPDLQIALLLGMNPDTLWVYDLEREKAWPIQTPRMNYSCATVSDTNTIALGGMGLSLYRFTRGPKGIDYDLRIFLNTQFQILTGAAACLQDHTLMLGNMKGKLIIIDLSNQDRKPLLNGFLPY